MPYRSPNSYARFVETPGPANNPGSSRVMALVGTGLKYFDIFNEAIRKSNDKPYEELRYSNVFEIKSISSKPIYEGERNPNNKVYTQGEDFELKDEKYICWDMLTDSEPAVEKIEMATEGSKVFNDHVEVMVDANKSHFVEDGEYLIEITYINENEGMGSGAYRVIDQETQKVLGEYGAEDSFKFGVIPGIKLKVDSTFGLDNDSNLATSVGDYIMVKTTAGKTEEEPNIAIQNPNSLDLENKIQSLMTIDQEKVETNTYDITITDAASEQFKIIDNNSSVELYSGTVGDQAEYLDIIPGITFIFEELPTNVTDGDTITIETTARQVSNAPAEGEVFYVTYRYKKAEEDYKPKIFFDYDDVVDEYGNYEVTASGKVINSLSLGAEIAYQNGVNPIICVQAKNDSDYEMKKAIDKLKRALPGVDNVNTIVPLTESPFVGSYATNHVNYMSSPEQGKERMVYLGASRNQAITKNKTATDPTIGMKETAESYSYERVVYVTPGEIIKEIKDLRTGNIVERTLPACYPAVAVAALGLVNDPAEPLTRKNINGFKKLSRNLLESEMNSLASSGCLVLQQKGTTISVRHGITTQTADINSNEITLIQIKDYVIDACRDATDELYVGRKNMPNLVGEVKYTIESILNQFISQEVILGVKGLKVKRDPNDPRQINVDFRIEAVYPLNYINITFGFAATA
jgi:hypothetical protein